jgi:ABC-type Fe3+/spermidine/putrescine transport system ATPase subunit
VLNQGRIEQTDTPNELFYNPKTKFVARFVGAKNRVPAQAFKIKVKTA